MKVVIIGGGIAGLSLGIFLRKETNFDVVICERFAGIPVMGHAFLMHGDGLSLLNKLSEETGVVLPSKSVDEFSFRRPDNTEIKNQKLTSWHCIKRVNLVHFLYSLFPADKVYSGRAFSHFIYENDKAVAAVFLNGDVEYGDIFVGADGGRSKVREAIFDNVAFTPVEVKEAVGIVNNEIIAAKYPSAFTKFQDKKRGIAFGFIPTSGNEFVWFMQYDPTIADLKNNTPEELKSFCFEMISDFPEVVKDILETNDFSATYVWETRDFNLLSTFHKQNVVLIGDAAHLTLPFTSAGTTNAIVDARTLAHCLAETENYNAAFRKLYQLRVKDISKHINKGRELKQQFLNPSALYTDDEIPMPLISNEEPVSTLLKNRDKQIQVLYFTDPICSTCWIIQPLLRKLKLEYDKYLNVEYRMGGLLPSWEQYNVGKINKPSDAAKHWEEVCAIHAMPLDGDVWIEDPIPSSYPPSVAFKAAQMQDTDKAIIFLRRIKEMVFLEKKNIIKWEHLKNAAFEAGLDSARLLRDYEGKAKELFRQDLILAEQLGVTGFPTLFFSNGINPGTDKPNNKYVVRGLQPYSRFEEIIQEMIPEATKENFNASPENLFAHFPTMTEKEFCYLGNLPREEALIILSDLYASGKIDKFDSKNGTIWISKFAA